MNIFISWSGDLSHAVALALREWLPQVVNAAKPWLSSQDIDKGTRCFSEVGASLAHAEFGILCLTPHNLNAPWILFEAGAISKSLDQSRVAPLLINLTNSDLPTPLTQFNTTALTKTDIQRLVKAINARLPDDRMRSETELERAFEVWWPHLESRLDEARSTPQHQAAGSPGKFPFNEYSCSEDGRFRYFPRSMQDETRRALADHIRAAAGPNDLFIAAAKLHSMGPWLCRMFSGIQTHDNLSSKIRRICVKRIRQDLLVRLASLGLLSEDFSSTLEANLKELQRECFAVQVPTLVSEWDLFPAFHGTLYGDLLTFAPWETDGMGRLSAYTPQIVMHESHNPGFFRKYAALLATGFE